MTCITYLGRTKQIWYLSAMRAAKVQASLRIRAGSEPRGVIQTESQISGPSEWLGIHS